MNGSVCTTEHISIEVDRSLAGRGRADDSILSGRGIGLIVSACRWCVSAGNAPSVMELGESITADGSHGTCLRVLNLPDGDTLQILDVAREVKCHNVAIGFDTGTY